MPTVTRSKWSVSKSAALTTTTRNKWSLSQTLCTPRFAVLVGCTRALCMQELEQDSVHAALHRAGWMHARVVIAALPSATRCYSVHAALRRAGWMHVRVCVVASLIGSSEFRVAPLGLGERVFARGQGLQVGCVGGSRGAHLCLPNGPCVARRCLNGVVSPGVDARKSEPIARRPQGQVEAPCTKQRLQQTKR